MVKVISGKYKGHTLKQFTLGSVRPTSGRVKKSIFQILEPIKGKRVLDLYTGIGSLGIESLSRGAEKVIMVEKSRKIVHILNQNLKKICSGDNFEIICCDVSTFLKKKLKGFDIIIADPPYNYQNYNKLKKIIKPHLKKNGVFCMEMKKCPILDNDVDLRSYGNTQVVFWRSLI